MPADVSALIAAAAIAFVVAAIGAGVAALSGPVHAPNARSNHARPTPVGGGVGVIAGAAAAWLWLASSGGVDIGEGARVFAGVILLGLAVGALGVIDDVFDLPAGPKFLILAVVAVLVALHAGAPGVLPLSAALAIPTPGLIGLAGASLFVFTLTNATNFLDGSNGLIAGSGAVAAAGLAALGHSAGAAEAAWIGAGVAGALLGFAPWNAPRAQVFLGDAGSLFVGALLAAAGLFVVQADARAVWLVALIALPWLADALLTLAWRVKAGARLGEAHKDHLYQRAIARGASHARVALAMSAASLASAAAAWACFIWAPDAAPVIFGLAAGLAFLVHRVLRRRWEAPASERAQASS